MFAFVEVIYLVEEHLYEPMTTSDYRSNPTAVRHIDHPTISSGYHCQ
jgi:hypothetical protein